MTTSLIILGGLLVASVVAWTAWRLASRRAVLPCPSEFACLVEMDNPLARPTRAACVIEQLAPQPGDRIMDIGCGPGRISIPLAEAVGPRGRVLAIDLQTDMLDRVRKRADAAGVRCIELLQADIRSGLLEEASVDGAVMVMVLGEVPGDESIFPHVFNALKPGGRFVIAESLFDPHFVRRQRVLDQATAAGFNELACTANLFAYCLVLGKP